MSEVLLIDYGASRIKSVYYSSIFESHIDSFESEGSFMKYGNSKSIPSSFFSNSMVCHLDYYFHESGIKKSKKDLKIYICSEMHGYALVPEGGSKEVLYSSWRFNHSKTDIAIKILEENNFIAKTMMKLRPGLPVVNVLGEFLDNNLKKNSVFLTLPQLICNELGEHYGRACKTILHSSGFYSELGEKEDVYLITGQNLPISFPSVLDDYAKPIGCISFKGYEFNLYFGFGDLQAAFVGSEVKNDQILINIGTGSQIISNSKNKSSFGLEERPFFNNEKLQCISHIPAGRFFESWNKFYKRLDLNINFWEQLINLGENDFKEGVLEINFNSFLDSESSAFDEIYNMVKTNNKISQKTILKSLINSFANQYSSFLDGKISAKSKVVLGGGIPNKIPILSWLLKNKLEREVLVLGDKETLTLKGMKKFLINQF